MVSVPANSKMQQPFDIPNKGRTTHITLPYNIRSMSAKSFMLKENNTQATMLYSKYKRLTWGSITCKWHQAQAWYARDSWFAPQPGQSELTPKTHYAQATECRQWFIHPGFETRGWVIRSLKQLQKLASPHTHGREWPVNPIGVQNSAFQEIWNLACKN